MTAAREAVRRLNAEGAVTLSHSRRARTHKLSRERIEELALRSLIETIFASRALPRAHGAMIDRMRQIDLESAAAISKHDAAG